MRVFTNHNLILLMRKLFGRDLDPILEGLGRVPVKDEWKMLD